MPSHKDISGNELADKQAKEAAAEMKSQERTIPLILDKKEAVSEIKKHMLEKWNRRDKG